MPGFPPRTVILEAGTRTFWLVHSLPLMLDMFIIEPLLLFRISGIAQRAINTMLVTCFLSELF